MPKVYVARLRCLLRPVVVLEDKPGRLYNAFGRSPDEAVFLVSTKAGSAKALLQFWGAQRGRLERELVEAAVTGQPYTAVLLDNPAKRALASPLLSMVLAGDFATLQEWMTSPGVRRRARSPQLYRPGRRRARHPAKSGAGGGIAATRRRLGGAGAPAFPVPAGRLAPGGDPDPRGQGPPGRDPKRSCRKARKPRRPRPAALCAKRC